MSAPAIVVIGLGSPVLRDDAVGLAVVQALAPRLAPGAVAICECGCGGIRLMELLKGYSRAVIVDAITTGRQPPGTVVELNMDEAIPTVRATGYHDLSLRDALAFGRALGVPLPSEVTFIAVEAEDTLTFDTRLTPAVAAAVPAAAQRVESRLREWGISPEEPCTKPASPSS